MVWWYEELIECASLVFAFFFASIQSYTVLDIEKPFVSYIRLCEERRKKQIASEPGEIKSPKEGKVKTTQSKKERWSEGES